MNHPGIYLSALWAGLLSISIMFLTPIPARQTQPIKGNYVCPPCGCGMHSPEKHFDEPGKCPACSMPLIQMTGLRSPFFEALFKIERFISYFHFKLFYPAYFLGLFVGIVGLFRYRKKGIIPLFYLFFTSHVFYAFKHQLSGTSYSLFMPMRWQFFPAAFLLLTGPALYLYLKNRTERKKQLKRKDVWHFLPGLLVILAYSLFFIGPAYWRDWARYNNFDHYIGVAEQLTFLFSGTYYLIRSVQVVNQQEEPDKWAKGWLGVQLLVLISWGIMLSANLLLFRMMATSLDYHPIWTLMAGFSLVGAYFMLFRHDLIAMTGPKKENLLTDDLLASLKLKLESVMQQEKPYLDPSLNLPSLAQSVAVKEKELSELLHSGFGSSFYAYVNQYRIEEVKKMLLDPDNQQFTNFAVAQQAGFSSKSTFFHLFKKHTGMTPGAYKKKHLK